MFGRTLIGQLPYSQKGGNAAVFHMSCGVVESDLERMWGLESFLVGGNVLHTAAKLFDPSGFVSPFLIRIKCLLQELRQLGVRWDEVASGQVGGNWSAWCKEIEHLQKLKIPRYYYSPTNLINRNDLQFHVFSDASPKSFGAVAYLRYKISDRNFNTRFVISKSRVVPIKKIALPRLELMSAVIAARLVKHLKRIFKDIKKIILWSDSTIVLYWIKGSASKCKPFVSNRISEIQENTDPASWRHCSGKQNPADLLTRGVTSKELVNSEKWWHGPDWLKDSENLWPKKYIVKGPLAAEELSNAEIFWVKVTHNDFYISEITCLKRKENFTKGLEVVVLEPFPGWQRGSARKSRKNNSFISELETSYYSPLPSLGEREKYWILKARQTIKSLLKKCLTCKRFNSNPGSQVTAPLPDVRVMESPPFSVVGLDFAGPLFVEDNDAKQYILLITCALIRSIHLELVGSMTTDTFLLAFRRGLSSMVISDNARTFKRAELELQQMWKVLNHADVKNFYSAQSIKWNYIVERAAWWGGFYEHMVRSVKVALRKTLGRSSLTTEQLLTVLTEIEGMINSRPITYVGSETEEPIPLTPAHFIIEKRITSLPPVRLRLDSNLSSRKCLIKAFNYREKLMRSFWSRWKNENLLNLISVHPSTLKNASEFKINDVVLIKDDQLPRNFWKLGKILELFPGTDGKVRACKIKIDSYIIKHPVQLLYNLEIQD
ncbi:integrase catalytic domain-containing protein [Trichonephila clavipes]|nr:integrase catalytic domain-containing protein [Trichonephila clavipes]